MSDEKIIISPDTKRENRIPPGQHLVEHWPILHEGRVQEIPDSKWSLRIFGLVKKETTIDFTGFMNLAKVKVFSDIHCVTTWSKLDVTWEGIGTSALREIAEILPAAKHVMAHCPGGYTTNLRIEDFFAEDALFAIKRDGERIEAKFGHPVRLVVPRLYYWKSAKWVNGIEFMAEEKPGFWESRGYHIRGDPWKEERYSG